MEKHKYNFFPEMLPDDYKRLKGDIENNGYDKSYPIWFYEGRVLDGWNRERACAELGIEPVYAEFQGTDIDAIEFVMRSNKRRNLTSSQWACIAVEADEIIYTLKQAAKEKQGQRNDLTSVNLLTNVMSVNESRTDAKIADIFNTNRQYVYEAQKLKDEKPGVFEQIKRGEKTITEAKKEVKIQERKEQIQKQIEQIEKGELPRLRGKYNVIAIDPPWAYEEKGGLSYNDFDPENTRGVVEYPTMTVQQIKAIELPLMDDGIVFLWTTHAFVRDAFDIIEAWGLKYKATLVWDKEIMGMGRTIRLQCEFCLIAFKGSPYFNGSSERDIIRARRREHSRKPDEFFEFVNRFTQGRRLEYFSREKREGWDIYGNDTEKF